MTKKHVGWILGAAVIVALGVALVWSLITLSEAATKIEDLKNQSFEQSVEIDDLKEKNLDLEGQIQLRDGELETADLRAAFNGCMMASYTLSSATTNMTPETKVHLAEMECNQILEETGVDEFVYTWAKWFDTEIT